MILPIFRKFWISFVSENKMMKNTLIFCDVRNVTVFVQFRHIFGPPKFRSSQIGPPQKSLVRYSIKTMYIVWSNFAVHNTRDTTNFPVSAVTI